MYVVQHYSKGNNNYSHHLNFLELVSLVTETTVLELKWNQKTPDWNNSQTAKC